MHSLDRRWRVGTLLLVLAAVVAGALAVWDVWSTMVIYGVYGPGVIPHLDINPFDAVGFALLLWATVAPLAGARRRERLRARALAGDLDAMPLSRVVPDQARAPDVGAEPLVIAHVGRGVITSTGDELIFSRPRHRGIAIAWRDALLLEVWTLDTGKTERRGYTLYGRDAFIEWDMPAGGKKLAPTEDGLRRALLDVIVAHTGLAPRTLSPKLQASSAPAPRTRRFSVSGTVTIAVLVTLPFALAATALALPLTHEPLLNDYVALSLSVIGLILLVVAIRAYLALLHPAPTSADAAFAPFQVAPPPDTTGTGVYGLRWGKPLGDRLIECALGLLLVADALPAIVSLSEFAAPPDAVAPPHPPQQYLAGALFLPAIIGAALLVFGLSPGRHAVVADVKGLSMRSGRRTEVLLWDDVERVMAHASRGRITRYEVIGDEGEVTIAWPAKVHATPRTGTQAVTPGELAALVVARSGKALRVVGD